MFRAAARLRTTRGLAGGAGPGAGSLDDRQGARTRKPGACGPCKAASIPCIGIFLVTTDSWQNGVSGDWSTGSCWSNGIPSSSSTVSIGGSNGFVVTLLGTGTAAAMTLNAPQAEFYDAGALTLSGVLALQAGTFALAWGTLASATIDMEGGTFLSTGGMLSGDTVDGVLALTTSQSTLFVENGLGLTGASGSGAGSIALTGAYSSLDFLGSQSLSNAQIAIGATGTQPGQTGDATLQITHEAGATAGATLSLGSGVWVRDSGQGQIAVGSLSPAFGVALPDELVNAGTLSASNAGSTLTIAGSGTLVNQGTIAVSNGALLEVATAGVQNTGTITVNNATLALGGTFSSYLLSGLGNITLSSGQVEIAGLAELGGGTLSLGTGSSITGSLGALGLTGTLQGGTIIDAGGGFNFSAGIGTLSGVTYKGTLSLATNAAGVTLTGGTEVSGGSISVIGGGAELLLLGSETLNNVTIALGSSGQAAAIGTSDTWLASNATTATLGPQVSLRQTGEYAALQANGFSPFAGFGLSDTLVNQGTVTAAVAGGTLAVSGYGTFINQGSIAVSSGDSLLDTAETFANTGTITVGAGSVAMIGGTGGNPFGQTLSWSNTGSIVVNGGSLFLEGDAVTSQLGTVAESGGGLVTLAGTLSNTGATVLIGAASGLGTVSLTGTVIGGTINDTSSALGFGNAGTALLQGASYRGTLAITGAGAVLNVSGGLSVSGQVNLLGAGAILDFIGTQSFGGTVVDIGATSQAATLQLSHQYGASGASTLTLASNLSVTQAGTLAAIGGAGEVAGDAIVNAGKITANVAGGTLTLGGQNFVNKGQITVGNGDTLAIASLQFSNTGAIAINNASLSLAGSLTLAGLGQIALNNASLSESGTLNLGGGAIAIGQGSTFGRVSLTGTIANGTITDGGGGLGGTGAADLSDITYQGLLDLTRPFAKLSISNGLTLTGAGGSGTGSIAVTGAEAEFLAIGAETLNNCAITLGSPIAVYGGQTLTLPELAAGAGGLLTIGPNASITLVGQGGVLGDSGVGRWTDDIVNDGAINTSLSGATLTIGSTNFLNAGTITAQQSGILYINDADFQNTGTLAVGQQSVVQVSLFDYFAAPQTAPSIVTNSGIIAMEGGIIHEMNAGGLFPFVPFDNLASGDIVGFGTLIAPTSNAGTIEAKGGMLSVQSILSGAGTLLIDAGATLDLANVVGAGQQVDFASSSGTLRLDQPSSFSGQLANFGTGDTIDLAGQSLTAVAISNGTLAVNTPSQQFMISGTAPLNGALEAGHDGQGGATIQYTPHVPGSTGPATLFVNQPGMLFWTTPSGDILQGASANLNGGQACNWGPNSSIDITDIAPSLAHLTVTANGAATDVAVTGGGHSCTMVLDASIGANSFHLSSDGHGGTMITT
jgi:hypothetical protein